MSKHTPGPWEIKNQNLVAEGGNCVLANLHMWQGDAPDEGKANARLIAAAPETAAERDRLRKVNAELLKALRLISGLCDDEPADIKARGLSRCCRINEFARAAIAKAEAA